MTHDVIVLGGGPAGIAAALAAAAAGQRVVLLDEQPQAGGQVYRAMPPGFSIRNGASADHAEGTRLRAELDRSAVEKRFGRGVWFVAPGFVVKALHADGIETIEAPRLIVATGAIERIVPIPGWTLPGVIGLAAATVLLKSQQMLPGARTVVAGVGPLLYAVAAGVLKGGGQVAAIVDLAPFGAWLATIPALSAQPALLARGVGWLAAISRASVPVLRGHTVTAIEGDERATTVRVAPVDRDGRVVGAERRFDCDSVALGHGLLPSTDVTRLLGARHEFRPDEGGWVPVLDQDGRTSITGLYVAGDGAGIAGAAAALLRGELAGLAAAQDAGAAGSRQAEQQAAARNKLAGARRFGGAMAAMMRPRPALIDLVAPDGVVCRCEDVTRAEIDDAIAAGAREVNQLKSWTRCGMGPCQGRICGDAVATLVARSTGSRENAGQFTGRPPLRPLPYSAATGTFDYAELNLPEPAPS